MPDYTQKELKQRQRNFCFILYPESVPLDPQTFLDDLHIPFLISPLHDRDLHLDGTLKKPHWHVMLCFGSVHTYGQVLEWLEPMGVQYIEPVKDINAMTRYFFHLDNPEKAIYSVDDCRAGGGFDVVQYLSPGRTQQDIYITEMLDYIVDHDVVEFYSLFLFARHYKRDTWYPLLCHSCANLINLVISSRKRIIADKENAVC